MQPSSPTADSRPLAAWRRSPLAIALLMGPILAAPLPPASQAPDLREHIDAYLELREESPDERLRECRFRTSERCRALRQRRGDEFFARLVLLGEIDRDRLPPEARVDHHALEYRLRAGSLELLEPGYGAAIYRHTAMRLEPERIHERGRAEVERIRGQMEGLVVAAGGEPGDLREFLDRARTDSRLFATDERELSEELDVLRGRILERVSILFERMPREPWVVRPLERLEGSFMARYFGDGRPPAVIGLNPDPDQVPLYMLEALLLHEALPGHHLQLALARENPDIPDWRRGVLPTAYVEGWGLYAESLGRQIELYRHPLDELGRLNLEMWRALRMVVDTGIHEYGWPEERGVELFLEHTSLPVEQIRVEVNRYAANPGQAVAYKLGELELLRLRDEARERLGSAFTYPGFHEVVLRHGPLPLQAIEEAVDGWIEARLSA